MIVINSSPKLPAPKSTTSIFTLFTISKKVHIQTESFAQNLTNI